MIFCDDDDSAKNNAVPPSAEAINTIRYSIDRKNIDDAWATDGTVMNGICFICNRGKANFVANCGHEFHYGCLCRNVNISGEQRCPACTM